MKIALISDIHEDVESLMQALRQIEKEKCDQVVCLGDIVGFSHLYYKHGSTRNASECIRLVKENCSIVIPGNHDYYAIKRLPLNNNGFRYPENWYGLSGSEQAEVADNKVWLYDDGELETNINEEQANWLAALPEFKTNCVDNDTILYSHYIYPNITGSLRNFYHEKHDFVPHKEFVKEQGVIVSFCGHRHYLGLMIASHKMITKGFNKTCRLKELDAILIPPVVNSRFESGFCIFDTFRKTVTAKRIINVR